MSTYKEFPVWQDKSGSWYMAGLKQEHKKNIDRATWYMAGLKQEHEKNIDRATWYMAGLKK